MRACDAGTMLGAAVRAERGDARGWLVRARPAPRDARDALKSGDRARGTLTGIAALSRAVAREKRGRAGLAPECRTRVPLRSRRARPTVRATMRERSGPRCRASHVRRRSFCRVISEVGRPPDWRVGRMRSGPGVATVRRVCVRPSVRRLATTTRGHSPRRAEAAGRAPCSRAPRQATREELACVQCGCALLRCSCGTLASHWMYFAARWEVPAETAIQLALGSIRVNVDPTPSRLRVIVSSPPIPRARSRLIARPRPTPSRVRV